MKKTSLDGKRKLIVQWGGKTVGHLLPHRKGNVTFAYTPEWLARCWRFGDSD